MTTLYRSSLVRTFGEPASGEWVLVDERHIERVGSGEPPTADRVVDLPGTTIIPGAIDAHVHLTGTGIHARWPQAAEARNGRELLDALSTIATEVDAPVLVHGFDESTWQPADLPTRSDLDRSSSRPLIVVRTDGHLSLANTAAFEEAGITDLAGLERDADGELTGLATQAANEGLQRWYMRQLGDLEVEQLQLAAASIAASRGVTCVHEMAIPAARGHRDIEVLLGHRTDLPVDVIAYIATKEIPYVMDLGLPRIGGDLSLDGSLGARTAWMSEGYVDGEGTGVSYEDADELAAFLHEAHLAGLQVAMHAIGDAAIEQAISAWERVYRTLDSRLRRHFRARRHRIEHFEMPVGSQIERAAALGLGISVQPAFDSAWGFPGQLYEQRLGEARSVEMNPFRTMIERGLTLAAGSDAPITPLDPWAGLAALERHHDPAQSLSREDSLRLFTVGGARLAHLPKKGRLEPGMHADFAAYDEDPMTTSDPATLRPVFTVSLGRDVYVQ